ncbi:sensor histidine kinase [Aquimarina sp. 2201CG5-10]|uniref:sensor histidine kinase n=1 Tax=Aquimarina callyspongiae TaxID=3098150 RepID=UPI002AB42A42|nr:histidine kinase [Aquimarina sp. 2201CG5-10]MDY8135990.1 histidine kinase [Aquimarina sp. 2201CG5-10]
MFQISDKTIQIIKTTFNVIFISIITIQFIEKAFNTLPNKWLFFITSDAVEYFIFAIISYVLYYYVSKRKLFWHKTSYVVFFIIIIALLASLKSYRIHDKVLSERTFDFFTEFLGKTFLFCVLIYFVNRLEFLYRYKKIEIELNQVKKQLLRNQLHPHFLFNAFNSLYSMSLKNNPKTPDTILKLSNMMRYLTDDSICKQVKLIHELKFIEEYITIEKIRFGEQANIHLYIDGNPEGKNIEPLLLMVLVENAFKHGFYTNDINSFVEIKVKIIDHNLFFTVKNSVQKKQHFNKSNREGIGLKNFKKRLQLSYPKTSKYSLQLKNNIYLAHLEINLQ